MPLGESTGVLKMRMGVRARVDCLALVGEILLGDVLESRRAAGFIDWSVGQVVAAADDPVAGNVDQVDRTRFSGFESHGGARGDVQPLAIGGVAVEREAGVGLDEVVMAADLDGAVAEVNIDVREKKKR